jgi:signal transduction histidine kinase
MRRLRHAEKIGQQNITVGKIYREAEVVRIDGAQIWEAIDSIIANAIEAMPAAGFLTINTDKGIRWGTWPLDCNKDSRGRGGEKIRLDSAEGKGTTVTLLFPDVGTA